MIDTENFLSTMVHTTVIKRNKSLCTSVIAVLAFILSFVQLFTNVVGNETSQFRCVRSGELVPLTSVCDSLVDCSDGSDETTCEGKFSVLA